MLAAKQTERGGIAVGRRLMCRNIRRNSLVGLGLLLAVATPLDAAFHLGECGDDATPVSAIQGNGSASPLVGNRLVVEAVVVGDYQETGITHPARPELGGFFLQEEDTDNDSDAASSEGIFVYDPDKSLEVAEGDLVRVAGRASEMSGNTQIDSLTDLRVCATGRSVTPASIDLPIPDSFTSIDEFWEQYEGMLLSFVDPMTVSEQFELARYGQLLMSEGGTLRQYSQDAPLPLNEADYLGWLDDQARRSIKLDDYNSQQNIDPVFHPQPGGFAVDNYIRIGATAALRGVLEMRFDEWNLQPQKTMPSHFSNPPRPTAPPELGGNVAIAALNVLNYFNGDGLGGGFPTPRGADSPAELDRQTDKIVNAITVLDADVLGLMEIENDGDGANDALAYLVNAVNTVAGAATYAFVPAGTNGGTDEIKVAMMYKPTVVEPVGPARVLADPAFTDPNNYGTQMSRPALAQTFRVIDTGNPDRGAAFTAVVLHLKSKGSACGAGDDDVVQGNCNGTRTKGAMALLNWLATDPTDTLANLGIVDPDIFIMGDLNSYYQEAPMQVLFNAGYTSLIAQSETSFVFGGSQGLLDYVLASASLFGQWAGGGIWNINAEENSLLDYNDTLLDAGEQPFEARPSFHPLYAHGPFRSSDHNPVLAGIDLADPPEVSSHGPADYDGNQGEPDVGVDPTGSKQPTVNTRFFEGIPPVNRFYLAMLALLVVATGLVAFRYFRG
jgi:predicted extracellular nuclease